MFQIEINKKSQKFLDNHKLKLPSIDKFINNKKRLKKINAYSLRIKDRYRILFELKRNIIRILRIDTRDKVYKNI